MRILNLGCGEDTYGTDFVDKFPVRKGIIKLDIDQKDLPYKDNTFDVLRTRQMIMYVTDFRHYIKECYRVLKKGGKLEITSASAGYYGVFTKWYDGYRNNKGHKFPAYSLHTTSTLKSVIELAPFKQIRTEYGFLEPIHSNIKVKMGAKVQQGLGTLSRRLKPNVIGSAVK